MQMAGQRLRCGMGEQVGDLQRAVALLRQVKMQPHQIQRAGPGIENDCAGCTGYPTTC